MIKGEYRYRIMSTRFEAWTGSDVSPERFLNDPAGLKQTVRDMHFRFKPDAMAIYGRHVDNEIWTVVHGHVDPRPTVFPVPPLDWSITDDWRVSVWIGKQAIAAYIRQPDERIEQAVVGTEFDVVFNARVKQESDIAAYARFRTSTRINEKYNEMQVAIGRYLQDTVTLQQMHEIVETLYELKNGATVIDPHAYKGGGL